MLLEPPFRWPFTTVLLVERARRLLLEPPFRWPFTTQGHITLRLAQGCLNHHFGGLSQLSWLKSHGLWRCLNHHFGGLSQLQVSSLPTHHELLEPPFRWPFTTHEQNNQTKFRSCLNHHFGGLSQRLSNGFGIEIRCLNHHFGGLSQRPGHGGGAAVKLLEPPFRWPFTT